MKNKNLLFFIPEFPVITETFIEREITKLSERGVLDIKVLSLQKGNNIELPRGLQDKVSYRRLDTLAIIKIPFFFIGNIGKCIEAFNLTKNYKKGFIQRIYLFVKSIGYSIIFKEYHPDFIISHFLSEPSTIVMLVSKMLNIPYGISAHAKDVTVEHELAKEKIETSKFILICNKAAWEFAKSLSTKEDPSNVYLRYHGVDPLTLSKPIDLPERSKLPSILTIGRFVEKKGLTYLLHASRILKERGLQHRIYVAYGKGPLYETILKEIKDLHLEDTVEILGSNIGVPFSKVIQYYYMSDILVFPSINADSGDIDGIANALIEAALIRVPIISTDAGSSTELVKNGDTGIVIPQKNPEAIAEAIELLLKDKDLRDRITEHAYNHALPMFDISNTAMEIEEFVLKNIVE